MVATADRLLVSAGLSGPGLERVKCALEAGGVVGVPTDTVYGLAVQPSSQPGAIDRLFELKGRPGAVAIAVLVADFDQAAQLLQMNEGIARLAGTFWPGALTIVSHRAPNVDFVLGGDESSIGVRCPNSRYVRELCRRVGPLAVTSANRHGNPPATSALELRELFGAGLLIADGGICQGEPSTVIDVRTEPVLCLRNGAIDFEQVADCYNAGSLHRI